MFASSEDTSAEAQLVELANQLDRLLALADRDDEAIASIYLKTFELAPHRESGMRAALNAYAYLSALGHSRAALGLLEEMFGVYRADEECPNPVDARYPIRLAASAKIEKARVIAQKGLYQLALEELALVEHGKKAGAGGFSGMPAGRFRYFGPTEALVALFRAEFTSKLDPAAGLVRYRAIMRNCGEAGRAWVNLQGARYALDRAAVEGIFDLVRSDLFPFARADQELQDALTLCRTDECRAEALLLRARLRSTRREGAGQARGSEQEDFLIELIRKYGSVSLEKAESGGVVVEKPSCVAAMELSRLYRRTKRHASGARRIEELLGEVRDRDLAAHLTLALAELVADAEGPTSHAALKLYRRCLTEYAFEPYYPYDGRKPRYIVDAVPRRIREEILGASQR